MTDAEIDALLVRLEFVANNPITTIHEEIEDVSDKAAALIRELRQQGRRAEFAGRAMQGLLSFDGLGGNKGMESFVAEIACRHADTLLAELEKGRAK